LLQYFNTAQNPLAQHPSRYSPESIAELLESLRPFHLAKGEAVMLFNIRPQTNAQLSTILEDMSTRFSEEQQASILRIVADVLGQFPAAAQPNGNEAKGD
jgi:DNA-directed RNA polymerase subunit F